MLDWRQLLAHEGFAEIDMLQTVQRGGGANYETTRCPITIDGQRPASRLGSPRIGEHSQQISEEFAI